MQSLDSFSVVVSNYASVAVRIYDAERFVACAPQGRNDPVKDFFEAVNDMMYADGVDQIVAGSLKVAKAKQALATERPVFVKLPSGKSKTLSVDLSGFVSEQLLSKLYTIEMVRGNGQAGMCYKHFESFTRLSFGGRTMQPDHLLAEYDLNKENTVYMSYRFGALDASCELCSAARGQ